MSFDESLTIPPRPDIRFERERRRRRSGASLGVLFPPAVAFLVPFFGVLLSILTPFMAASFGQIVWGARKRRCVLAGIATLVAVWAPAIVNASLHSAMHTEYRLIPLCAPTGVTANLIVPLSAIAVYLAASLISIRYRNVWLWPVAALLGSITFEVGWTIIDEGVHWIC